MRRMTAVALALLVTLVLTSLAPAQAPVQSVTCAETGSPPRTECSSVYAKQVAQTPIVQNAAYSSGNCLGSFNSIEVTEVNGQSGFITNFRIASVGGSTPTVTIYIFDSQPTSSTCTDRSTFTLAAADIGKIVGLPAAVTLAAPTGSTPTFATTEFTPPRPFEAGGGLNSGLKTIYYALVSGSSFTPASTTDIRVRIGVALN